VIKGNKKKKKRKAVPERACNKRGRETVVVSKLTSNNKGYNCKCRLIQPVTYTLGKK
jgi:hypothetical protein